MGSPTKTELYKLCFSLVRGNFGGNDLYRTRDNSNKYQKKGHVLVVRVLMFLFVERGKRN